MILIADAGGTKTVWAVAHGDGTVARSVRTQGINPVTMSAEAVRRVVTDELLPGLAADSIERIHYYGAGVIADGERRIIAEALDPIGAAHTTVDSDMTGAARSLLGHCEGIVCILGTGSNSCLWDGARIVDNIPPLGYILGDEGSGAALGKRLVADILKRLMPAEVSSEWTRRFGLTKETVIDRVYRRPGGNSFLASFVPFVREMTVYPRVAAMVDDELERFFTRNIMGYSAMSDCREIGFTGSVAAVFAPELHDIATRHGYRVVQIAPDPMPGLVSYHTAR